MAIELVQPTPTFQHRACHDLESLLNTILTICHYTVGAGGQLRQPTHGDDGMLFNKWFSTADREQLACTKSITLEAYKTRIYPRLPEYWQDFSPFLVRLIKATWDGMPYLEHPNVATHEKYREVLRDALEYFEGTERPVPYPTGTLKRPLASTSRSQEPPSKIRRGNQEIPTPLPLSRMYHFESFDDTGRV